MPGWHQATKELQKQGRVKMLGVAQEQHADRARLFMQWQNIDWPILVDALNLLKVPYVPVTICIDESGIIQQIAPMSSNAKEIAEDFIARNYPTSVSAARPSVSKPDLTKLKPPAESRSPAEWGAYADALSIWGGSGRVGEAIDAYKMAITNDPNNDWLYFRLGVTFRKRFDSGDRRTGDFQEAVNYWAAALDIDPNNYIHRRRIQQYGPRLDKPYPFYDWVNSARAEIAERGDTPFGLTVEPGGSELAMSTQSFTAESTDRERPDAGGKIARDADLIDIEATAVPGRIIPGTLVRFHLQFRPNEKIEAHWNNEADDLVLWVDPPEGWRVNSRYLSVPNPRKKAVSREPRAIEVELKSPESVSSGSIEIPAYALYYVCEGKAGVCLYRRQDVTLIVQVEH